MSDVADGASVAVQLQAELAGLTIGALDRLGLGCVRVVVGHAVAAAEVRRGGVFLAQRGKRYLMGYVDADLVVVKGGGDA